jgi:hypothetical protein
MTVVQKLSGYADIREGTMAPGHYDPGRHYHAPDMKDVKPWPCNKKELATSSFRPAVVDHERFGLNHCGMVKHHPHHLLNKVHEHNVAVVKHEKKVKVGVISAFKMGRDHCGASSAAVVTAFKASGAKARASRHI